MFQLFGLATKHLDVPKDADATAANHQVFGVFFFLLVLNIIEQTAFEKQQPWIN